MIVLEHQRMFSESLGEGMGLSQSDLEEGLALALSHLDSLRTGESSDALPFLDISDREVRASIEAAERFAGRDLVVVGIGGSSLGARLLIEACSSVEPGRVRFLDTPDPVALRDLLDGLDMEGTLFNVVTKSGGTAETLALALAIREEILARGLEPRDLFLATTGPTGFLRDLASAEEWPTLTIPEPVGGRFSLLTPVGLFPAAMAGVDLEGLVRGARRGGEISLEDDPQRNPALTAAALLYLAGERLGKTILAFMPYGAALAPLAPWFVQLWAESLGKRAGAVLTPLAAYGPQDQHAQLQLFAEGPPDKVAAFVVAETSHADRELPAELPEGAPCHLAGRSLGELLRVEQEATARALAEAGRPSLCYRLEEPSAESLGALVVILMVQTVIAGRLLGVDPYGQPGVERTKVLIRELLADDVDRAPEED